jgi:hypothetical protein
MVDLDAARAIIGFGLGFLEMLAPRRVARAEGLDSGDASTNLVRIAGAHKLVSAGALAFNDDSRLGYRAALAGSVFDGVALAARRAKPQAFARLAALAAFDAWRLSKNSPG